MRKGPILGIALASTAAVALVAAVPVSRLLPWLPKSRDDLDTTNHYAPSARSSGRLDGGARR